MNKEITDNRLQIMKIYAEKILDDSLSLPELHSIFDEMVLFRAHYQHWYGELSAEYRLANHLLTFSRVFRTSNDSLDGQVSVWLKKHPLQSEWFARIKQSLAMFDEKNADLFSYS